MGRILNILTLYVSLHIAVILQECAGAAAPNPTMREVSHEDIRDAILSLVHMFRDNTDKLERHEYRERQLGEQLKKTLAAIEKKQKTEETNVDAIIETLNNVNKRLESLENAIAKGASKPVESVTSSVTSLEQSFQHALENIGQTIQNNELKLDSVRTNLMQKLEAVLLNVLQTQSSVSALEQRFGQQAANDNTDSTALVNKFDAKLTQLGTYHETLDKILTLQQNISEYIVEIQRNVARGLTVENLDQFTNATTDRLQQLKYDIETISEKGMLKLQEQIGKSQDILSQGQQNVLSAVTDTVGMNDGLNSNVQKSYDTLLKEVKGLSKIDQVLLQTADNVLDTKRRIEYGTHQILLEVGELIKLSAKDTNDTVNKRFDMISAEILENQNGALKNLSLKIETEISQVWRQIGIMYQTLTNSADALDKLQHQTEIYVNGSLNTMDNMEGKVGQITSRMSEVDENLNYLLGRLSLVTQEFNQIKTGLGQALDNIRSSFHTVQDKVKDAGPGPNPIVEDEDIDQLNKSRYSVN